MAAQTHTLSLSHTYGQAPACTGTPWKLLRLAEAHAAQPYGHAHVWFYSAQGTSSIAPGGGILDYRYAVYKSPPANVLGAHCHESAAKRPGPPASAPSCASGGPLTGTSALTAARERRRGGVPFTLVLPPWKCELGVPLCFFCPPKDGVRRAPYAMPRCDTGYLSNPTIWSSTRSIAARGRRRQPSH